MRHAIDILRAAREAALNNAPIHEAEGRPREAALAREVVSDVEEALIELKAHRRHPADPPPATGDTPAAEETEGGAG